MRGVASVALIRPIYPTSRPQTRAMFALQCTQHIRNDPLNPFVGERDVVVAQLKSKRQAALPGSNFGARARRLVDVEQSCRAYQWRTCGGNGLNGSLRMCWVHCSANMARVCGREVG